MLNTIMQLWNGTLEPISHLGLNNPDIRRLENLIQRNREKVEANLAESEKEIFEKYNDCINEYAILLSEQAFCDGFCLGTKITVEALTGAEEII